MRLALLVVARMSTDLCAHQVCVCVQVSACIGGCASEYVWAHLSVPSVQPSAFVCVGSVVMVVCLYQCVCSYVCVRVCMCSHITLELMSSFSGMGGGGWELPNHQPKHCSPPLTPQARAHPYCPLHDAPPPSGTRPRADFFQLLGSAFPGPHVVCEELNPEVGQARVPEAEATQVHMHTDTHLIHVCTEVSAHTRTPGTSANMHGHPQPLGAGARETGRAGQVQCAPRGPACHVLCLPSCIPYPPSVGVQVHGCWDRWRGRQRSLHRYPEAPEHTRMSTCVHGAMGAKCPTPGHLCTQGNCDPLHLLTNEGERGTDKTGPVLLFSWLCDLEQVAYPL